MGDPRHSASLERVVVIGSTGAGKTTFARDLALVLDIPTFDLDPLYHGPNWNPKTLDEFRELTRQAACGERWVASGNYAQVRDILWGRATTVIWLNYGFPTVFWRVFLRTMRRCLTREELWHGNRESFRLAFFSRHSVLLYVLTTFRWRQRQIGALRASGSYAHVTWQEFRRPDQARRYLASLQAPIAGSP
ncbi:toxin [Variovorax sp. J22R133]|uniref:toxin n=1 Tax=Variovorax brevis TaxID=3053503 RepID=UPI002576D661|nr:toxin [Variovorax sp. J22R133]MDM0115994.1 toxin [Variovorax sp. J22R133]